MLVFTSLAYGLTRSAPPAQAQAVRYDFAGTITLYRDAYGIFAGLLGEGESLSGSFVLDYGAPSEDLGDPNIGSYFLPYTFHEFTVSSGGFSVFPLDMGPSFRGATVYNDLFNPFDATTQDRFEVRYDVDTDPPGVGSPGIDFMDAYFTLVDSTANAIASTELPTNLNLANWDTATFDMYGEDFPGTQSPFSLFADITSLTAVPLNAADFSHDGLINADDLAAWSTGVGVLDGFNADGDADGDGDVDGADFLKWQRQISIDESIEVVAEPTSLFLALTTLVLCVVATQRGFSRKRWLSLFVPVIVISASSALPVAARQPNIVFILTDNQAAWTLGCYGNPDIRTPNIDRLARDGCRFSRSFACNAVCSPTRATLLTGLIPSQHGVHSYLTAGDAQMGPKAYNTIAEFRSLPEILSEAGYVCGLSGKWHLGANASPQDGFTTWITMPHGHTTTFYDAPIIDGGKVRKEPQYTTDFWTDRGVDFIKAQANSEKPFFLFLAYNGPYGIGETLSQPARNRHAAYYADKELKSFPREPQHPWQTANKKFHNDVNAMRRYAAEVSGVDDGVGRVMQTLDELELADDTLVIYTADQGLSAGQNGLWAMGDHTRPLTAYDPMIQTPLIFRHPGRIPEGATPELLVSTYDFFPSMLEYLGLKDKTPTEPPLPGHSYAAVLRGEPTDGKDDVFFEYENTRAIRTSEWKYIERFPDGPNELFNLANDPGERQNVVEQPDQADVKAELAGRLKKFFDQYADPKYDLSRNGKSKAQRRIKEAS